MTKDVNGRGRLEISFEAHRTSERGCDYQKVPCPNKCQESIKRTPFSLTKYFYRKDLASHLATNDCINRLHLCKFVAKLIHIGSHYSVCPEYSVSCPNL